MDIHEYPGVIRRGWAIIALGLIVGLVGAVGVQALQVPSYSATSREMLTTDTSGSLTQSLQAASFAEGRIASYVLVASSGLVLQPVIDELGLDMSVDELAANLAVTAPQQTLVIDITATAATPTLARDIANTTSRVFREAVTSQIQPVAVAAGVSPEAVVPIRMVNIEKASLPLAPISSGPLFLLLGGLLGLAAGLVVATVRETAGIVNGIPSGSRGRRSAALPSESAPTPVILNAPRPSPANSLLGRGLGALRSAVSSRTLLAMTIAQRAVGKKTRGGAVETIPTLAVGQTTPRRARGVVDAAPSRFAPDESTQPPITAVLTGNIELVTSVPTMVRAVTSRRSMRPEGSPSVVVSEPEAANAASDETDVEVETDVASRPTARTRDAQRAAPRMVTVGDYSNVTDITPSVSRERIARESYDLKLRELERAADERLANEQQLVERRILEHLEAGKRELDFTLDEILEDTIILPRAIATS